MFRQPVSIKSISQTAEGLAEADWLARSQGEGEVGRSLEEEDHGGAQVELSQRLALPQRQARPQQLLLGAGGGGGQGAGGGGGIAAVVVGAGGVARRVGLQLLRERLNYCKPVTSRVTYERYRMRHWLS